MVFAELLGNVRQGQAGHLADQVHGDLPRLRRTLGLLGAAQNAFLDGVEPADLADDEAGIGLLLVADDNLDDPGDVGHVDLPVLQVVIGLDFVDGALDLPHVVGEIFGDVVADLVGEGQAQRQGLVFDDGPAGLIIRRLHVDDEAALKPGTQAVLQAEHIRRHPVGGQDDLPVVFVEGVEGVEKFLLGGVLAGDELDVVHQKQVGVAVFVAEFEVFTAADGLDKLVGELLAPDVDDVVFRVLLLDAVGDGVEQVGFAQAALTVEKQGIVGGGSFLGDGLRGGKGVLVGGADHKGVKGILGIEFHKGASAFVEGILGEFLLVQDHQLDFRLELVPHGVLDQLGVAIEDHVLAEGGGRIDHQLFLVQLNDLRVIKIGGDGSGRRVLFQVG